MTAVPRPPGLVAGLVLLVVCIVAPACRSKPALENAKASSRELARAVLDALERRDVVALRTLALNEEEFRSNVWPELPAARPERNLPFSYVWGDLHQKSERRLAQAVAAYGGHRYDLLAVRSAGEITRYQTYNVHRDTVLSVRDAQGAGQELRVFGSMLEENGRWKVFSYVVDD